MHLINPFLVFCLAVGSFSGFVHADHASTFSDTSEFSNEEKRMLKRGDLVSRKMTRRQGAYKLVGGNCWQVLDVPLEVAWAKISDEETFPRWVPGVSSTKQVPNSDGKKLVHMKHSYGWVKGEYYLVLTAEDAGRTKTIRLQVDTSRPRSLETAWGFFRLQPYGKGKTLLTYGIAADFGNGVVTGLLRPMAHDWLLKVPRQFHQFLKRSSTYLSASAH